MKKVLFVSALLISGCATAPLTPQQIQANSLASAMVNRLDLTGKNKAEIIQMFGHAQPEYEHEWVYSNLFYANYSSNIGELNLHFENGIVIGGNYQVNYGEHWGFGKDENTRYNGLVGYERTEKQREDEEKAYQKYESERRMKAINEHPEWPVETRTKILDGSFAIGMTQEQVLASLGRPHDVNRTVGQFGIHEQWIYGSEDYARKYLYFEDGLLKSYQD